MRPDDLDDLAPVEPSAAALASVRDRGGALLRRRRRAQRAASVTVGALVAVLVVGILWSRGGSNSAVRTPGTTATTTTVSGGLTAHDLVGRWLPTAIAGYHGPLTRPALITSPNLSFDTGSRWTGDDGCNGLGGSYTLGRNGSIHFGEHTSTAVLCRRVEVPMDTVFTAARAEVVGDRLTFFGRDGHEVARFRRAVSARIVLPTQVIVAGSAISGQVVVENPTGHAIQATGCGSLFQVALASAEIRPIIAWDKCRQQFTIPVGESRYPVQVSGSYQGCDASAHGKIPACVNGGVPPLPSGEYAAVLYQGSPAVVPTPPPVAVTVVSQK